MTGVHSLLALLAIAAWGCAQEPRSAALDTILDTEMRELARPGVSAAMMEHGRLVWTGARGWADAEVKARAGFFIRPTVAS